MQTVTVTSLIIANGNNAKMRKGSGGSSSAGLFNPVALHHHLHSHHHQNPHHHPLLHPTHHSNHHSQPHSVGGPIIPPHLSFPAHLHSLQQQHHLHSQQQQQQLQQHLHNQSQSHNQQLNHHQSSSQSSPGGNMVQQRANPTPSGRIYLNSHHNPPGTYQLQQHNQSTGLVLQQQQNTGQGHHQSQSQGHGHPLPPGGGPLQHTAQMHGHHPGQRPIIPHGGAGFGNHPSGMGQGYMAAQHSNYGNNAGINSHFGTTVSRGLGENREGVGSSAGGDLPPVETVVARLETACRLLHGIGGNNTRVQEIGQEIQILSEDLRRVGALLENTYPEVLDRVMSSMRDASAQPCLPPSLRLAIFELVELRASKWILPSDSSNYYRQRRNLNDAAQANENLDERSGRSSASSGGATGSSSGGTGQSGNSGNVNSPQVTVVVTTPAQQQQQGNNGNVNQAGAMGIPVTVGVGTSGGPGSSSPNNNQVVSVDLDTPPQPQPAKTFREEIVIKNSDSGKVMGVRGRRVHLIEAISDTIISFEKVAPTAKERVLSINGYSQQSINLAKQLIQETITRNASPVLDGMVIPGSSSSPSSVGGAGGDLLSEISGVDDAELALKRMQLQTVANRVEGSVSSHGSKLGDHSPHHSSHFSYTVTLGEHQIKILGDDLQYVQEAKMALDDYFLQKYPDLFCANLNGIEEDDQEEMEEEDEEDDDEDFHDTCLQRYDRETLLNLSKVRTPPPDFSHLEPDIRGNIVLEKPRQFDLDKFSRETVGLATGTGSSTPMVSAPSSTPSTPSTPTATCNVGTLAAAAAVAAAVQAASTSNNNNGSGSGSKTADVLPG